MTSTLAKATSLWFAILLIAILNGLFREAVLGPSLGSVSALILSGTILSIGIFCLVFLAIHWFGPLPAAGYWSIGVYWLVLTIVFEFGFGRFVLQKPWSELLAQYTFQGGNLWPMVLAVIVVSPWVAARLRGLA